jgi:hypothetical protein
MIPPAPWVNGEGVQWEDLGELDSENIFVVLFPYNCSAFAAFILDYILWKIMLLVCSSSCCKLWCLNVCRAQLLV